MATETKGLKFFHVASLPETGVIGGIYFDTTKGEISVYGKSGWERYSGNVKSVVWSGTPANDSGKLVITNFDGSKSEIDFSDVASKTQVAKDIAAAKTEAVTEAKNYVNARKVNGKTLNEDIVLDGRDIKLDGYTKPASTEAIKATDTVNAALGKLEKAIENTTTGALTEVEAGAGINVTAKANNKQTISVKIDAASEKFGVGESAVPVLTASGDGLKISGIKNAIDTAIGGLDVPDAAEANQYVSSVSETDGKISVTRANLPVIGVADNDKILSLSGAKIGSSLSFEYNSAAKKIYLYGSAKDEAHKIGEVDCTDFIKDGMLESATYSDTTKELTLTFNTESGKQPIKVNLSKLVDTYEAKDGIKLEKLETDTHPTFKITLDSSKYLGIVDSKLRLDDEKIHTKISGDITTAINGLNSDASNATTATGAGDAASSQIKVTVSEAAGKLTGVTVNAPIFATPSDIETAENKLIGSDAVDTKDSNTIWGAKKYADDKAAAALGDAKTYTNGEIQKLDAEFTQAASATEGLALHVKQEDGKITAFSGSMNWCEW